MIKFKLCIISVSVLRRPPLNQHHRRSPTLQNFNKQRNPIAPSAFLVIFYEMSSGDHW
jgi:hypothetical protein